MAGLVLICQQCSTETDAIDMANGKCVACRIEAVTGDIRKELKRLRTKRDRYGRRGIALDSNNDQLRRVLLRLRATIEGLTKNAAKTERHLRSFLDSLEAEGQPIGLERLLVH